MFHENRGNPVPELQIILDFNTAKEVGNYDGANLNCKISKAPTRSPSSEEQLSVFFTVWILFLLPNQQCQINDSISFLTILINQQKLCIYSYSICQEQIDMQLCRADKEQSHLDDLEPPLVMIMGSCTQVMMNHISVGDDVQCL